ncbi:MAG: hypothetical protein HY690_20035 [Chloroflexi bacterium]|nr:hypothetical protein [Chloroflexota bacterium]
MGFARLRRLLSATGLALILVVAACAPPAPPAPTAAPARLAPTTAPAKPAATAAPAPTAAPAKPAATQAPAAKSTEAPAAKVDTKALEDFYKGKTLRLVVATAAGGGFDTFARILIRHFGKHIPGNPNIIVENMPGAGHVLAANAIYVTGAKDGTTIVNFSSAPILAHFFEEPGVQLDATKYLYLGVRELDHVACAVSKASGFNSLAEATGSRQLIIGGLAPSSNTDTIPNLLRNLVGLNLKVVTGYPGVNQVRMAVEKGEVMGVCFSWSGMKATWKEALDSGEVKVIAQAGKKPHPDLPNVPMIDSLARTDEQRQLIEAGINLPLEFAQVYALPPGVPAERVQTLREAFLATLKDPEFLPDAQKAGFEINPVTGPEVEQAVKRLFALSPELRAKLKTALTP